jgi:hypothetical protein
VNELALGDELARLGLCQLLPRLGRRKDEGKEKEAERDAEGRAEHAPQKKNRQPSPHGDTSRASQLGMENALERDPHKRSSANVTLAVSY